jgi:phage terminase large subunit
MNPFLSDSYKASLEELINQNPNYYRIYVLGEWGILENVIYTNWDIVDKIPPVEETIYGIDFGFEAPSALVSLGIKEKDIYIDELIYQKHLTNEDFILMTDSFGLNKNSYYFADSAEPARIVEFFNRGYNIQESNKDVVDGIDTVKRYNLHLTRRSVNTIKEFNGYSRKRDRLGNVLEEPIKFNDHAVSAVRYALHTYFAGGGVAELWAGLQ